MALTQRRLGNRLVVFLRCVVKFDLRRVGFRFYWLFGFLLVACSVVAGEQPLASAKILNIHPDLSVVIVDVGRLHGARIGMPYVVVQDDVVVAKLRLDDVRSLVSCAVVENLKLGKRISDFDRVQIINTQTIW